MEQVKIFQETANAVRTALETNINKWLSEMGDTIQITRTMQSSAAQANIVTVMIFFTKIS